MIFNGLMGKLFVSSALMLLLCAATLWAQVKYNGKLEKEINAVNEKLILKSALVEKERAEALAAEFRAGYYQSLRKKSDEEIVDLERCIADKSCVPRVRVYVNCPGGLSEAETPAGRTEVATAELGPDDTRMAIRIREAAKLMRDRYLWMQSELVARSDPKYCSLKK
jgi:hypothetical protein